MNTQEKRITAVQSSTQYAEIQDYKIAYHSIREGPPFILLNRFRGNLYDWDLVFFDALAKNLRNQYYSRVKKSFKRPFEFCGKN
jgi:hypothetical protein